MSLQNFDPTTVILLDGYELVKACYPKINLYDYSSARKALDFILKKYTPAPTREATNNGGYWIRWTETILDEENSESSEKNSELGLPTETSFDSLEKKLDTSSWCVNWLLPSGLIVTQVRRVDYQASFFYKDVEHVQFSDDSIVSLDFSLDTRFLDLY